MKMVKTLKKLTKKDTAMMKDMGCVMSCSDAAMIPGTPNAFISPNAPGVMKDIHMPMAPVSVGPAPPSAPAYDQAHRTRGRQGYGDRAY
jgi:hypothetical protein